MKFEKSSVLNVEILMLEVPSKIGKINFAKTNIIFVANIRHRK